VELSPKQREKDLEAIKRVSPETYAKVLDDGLHGRMKDEDLHLAAARMKAWERKVQDK
jgi:hypothetical protein